MDIYLKAAGMTVIAVILWMILNGYSKNFSVLMSVAACGILLLASSDYLKAVLSFLEDLTQDGGLDSELLRILLRSVGVGLLGEIIALICTDAGNAALGKALSILSTTVIVWNSLPVFTSLMELISQILGEL